MSRQALSDIYKNMVIFDFSQTFAKLATVFLLEIQILMGILQNEILL